MQSMNLVQIGANLFDERIAIARCSATSRKYRVSIYNIIKYNNIKYFDIFNVKQNYSLLTVPV